MSGTGHRAAVLGKPSGPWLRLEGRVLNGYLETGHFQKYHSDLTTPETDLCPNEVTF